MAGRNFSVQSNPCPHPRSILGEHRPSVTRRGQRTLPGKRAPCLSGARRSGVAPRRAAACYPSAMTRRLAVRLVLAAWAVAPVGGAVPARVPGAPEGSCPVGGGYLV